jgi:fatty acid desaturase
MRLGSRRNQPIKMVPAPDFNRGWRFAVAVGAALCALLWVWSVLNLVGGVVGVWFG